MPRTCGEIIDHADQRADEAEAFEPTVGGHADASAGLRSSVIANAESEQQLDAAVRRARDDGMSFASIGVILGVSGEAVRKRGHQRRLGP